MSTTGELRELATTTWDVVVLGAGVAGALAARQLALAGGRVLLLDKRAGHRWKVCGACLNGRALQILDEVGLSSEVRALGGEALKSFQVGCRNQVSTLPLTTGLAVSRNGLDHLLIAAAVAAGAVLAEGTQATVLEGAQPAGGSSDEPAGPCVIRLVRGGTHEAVEIASKCVVVATGLSAWRSTELTGWTTQVSPAARIGLGCAVVDETEIYPPGVLAMGVSRHGYVGLVRVEGGELNIAAAIDAAYLKELKGPGPAAVQLLAGTGLPIPAALRDADWVGTPTLTRTTRPLAHRGIFLIGDAAGYVEPFTGEGMAWAMEGALGVVRHVLGEVGSEPAGESCAAHRKGPSWDAEYRRRLQSRLRTCRMIRWGVRWPRLVNLATRTLEHWPRLSRPIIAHLQAAGK